VTSTGGTVSLSGGGQLSGTGKLDVSGSTWGLGGDFVKDNGTLTSSGTLTLSETDLGLSGNSKLTSDVALSFVNLNLNDSKLTLGSSTSDLTIENAITIDSSGEGILTGEADLILLSSLNMSQGLLGSTGGTWVLIKDFLKSGGTMTISQTDLELKDSIKLTSDQALSFVFVTLNLNNFTLTLGSSTSDLTVINAITIDASTEGILTGGADLLLSALTLSDGGVTSTGGIVSLSGGGQLSGTGKLDVSGSTWVLGGDFLKSGGTLTISQTDLKLAGNSKLTSDEALSFVTLNLNNFKLTLGSSTSDLTVINAITIDASTEGILTGEADLILLSALTMSEGLLESSGGTWVLSKDFLKSGGTLTISQTNLELKDSIKLTSDVALSFVTLKLNSKTLTLGSATSDLTVKSPLNDTGFISSTTEGISTGGADLILKSHLIIDGEGSVTSTSGEVSFLAGGRLSGSGKLDLSGSTWVLGGDFEKRPVVGSQLSGTLTISQTDFKLADNSTLTSDEALNFVNLNLNDYALTLGSSTSDLTVQNTITIDSSGEGLLTGEADLILLSSLNMSQGLLGSTGGTWVLIKDFLKSGGTLTISQTDLELKDSIKLTSDQALSFVFATLNLNNFTLTLGSSTSDLTV